MAEFRPGKHECSVELQGRTLHFACDFKADAAPLVLFLHGLACSRDSFRGVFGQPGFPAWTLLLPDLLGFGRSDKPEDFSYSMEEQAGLIGRLLSLFPAREVHLVAHSMGSAVALLLSPAALSRVVSFACVEGNLVAEDCGLLSRGIAAADYGEYTASMFPEQQKQFNGHAQLRFAETTPLAVHRSARSLVQWSESGQLLERFRKLACRKAYFWGEENRAMPVLQRLRGIESIMIPRSGHGMMTDNPASFYQALAGFIRS